jgi:hypothetical protein
MRRTILAAGILAALYAPAAAQCAGNDHVCWHNREFEKFMEQTRQSAQQGPGLLDFIFTQQRAAEEHELRMKIMREHLRRLEEERCPLGVKADGSCWRPRKVGD